MAYFARKSSPLEQRASLGNNLKKHGDDPSSSSGARPVSPRGLAQRIQDGEDLSRPSGPISPRLRESLGGGGPPSSDPLPSSQPPHPQAQTQTHTPTQTQTQGKGEGEGLGGGLGGGGHGEGGHGEGGHGGGFGGGFGGGEQPRTERLSSAPTVLQQLREGWDQKIGEWGDAWNQRNSGRPGQKNNLLGDKRPSEGDMRATDNSSTRKYMLTASRIYMGKVEDPDSEEPSGTRTSSPALADPRASENWADGEQEAADDEAWERPELQRYKGGVWKETPVPPLNIVMMIIGSRGDVQPFLALAQRLIKAGHSVRLATHNDFKDFVEKNGVEFFPLGGDPKELMAFMVKHPDMITFDQKEIKANRRQMEQVFETAWLAAGRGKPEEYYPDIIISNPPVQVHVHIANALQIPLQIMFTMPWSPTKDYVHPLATLGAGVLYGNKGSYRVVDELLWVGMKKEINVLRKRMGLSKCHRAGSFPATMKVPHTYCMSPHLAVRPRDWGPHIDVVGFWFLEGSGHGKYDPPKDLIDFLEAGDPPVYIGFGSVIVSDPQGLTRTIFQAVQKAKVRAIVSEGWGGMGSGQDVPESIYLIGACPHTWLFERCSAVCHHGGAGTTATGLMAGKPTIIVPFFGDQPFWGKCVSQADCGPDPIPIKDLNVDNLTRALEYCQVKSVKRNAIAMGKKISEEDGVGDGVAAFHRKLPLNENGEWVVDIYENQRFGIAGWKAVIHKLRNRHPWSDRSGYLPLSKEKFYLPKGWSWITDWEVDINEHTDKDGWRYAKESKHSVLHKTNNSIDTFRMRRWTRKRVHTKHFLSYSHRIQQNMSPRRSMQGED